MTVSKALLSAGSEPRPANDPGKGRAPEREGMKESPLVSVIVRTRDRPELLAETLKSLAAQSHAPLEVVLVNDGGRDVRALAEEVCSGLSLALVTHEARRGRSAAANSGLRASRGRYLNFCDDDDVLYPDHVETLVSVLESTGEKVAYTGVRNVYFSGPSAEASTKLRDEVVFNKPFDPDLLLFENYIPLMSVMFSREILEEVEGFDEALDLFEDWDFWVRVSRRHRFLHVDKITAEYRFYGNLEMEPAHRGKYAYDRARAAMFEKVRPYLTGESWLRFLDHGVPGRLREDNRLAQVELRRLQDAHDRCAAWGHDLQAELESLREAHESSAARGESLQVELAKLQEAHDRCAAWGESLQAELAKLQEAHDRCASWAQGLQAELDAMRRSMSWRITAPLRAIKRRASGAARDAKGAAFRGLRKAYWALPVPGSVRFRLKSLVFERLDAAFRGFNPEAAPPVSAWPEDFLFDAREAPEGGVLDFPDVEDPEVSVVVSLAGASGPLFAFLRSIRKACGGRGYEVVGVVAESRQGEATLRELENVVRGWRIVRAKGDLSETECWNLGAEAAGGRYLAFVHGPSRLGPGWLEELLRVFRECPEAGLVSSRLIDSRGRIHEAGGTVTAAGDLVRIGAGSDRRHPAHGYLREVDFCSALSCMIPSGLFREIGGFAPQDPESPMLTGLEFSRRVRSAGREIFLAPHSLLVLDPMALKESPSARVDAGRPGTRGPEPRGRILVLNAWTPTPDQDSGSQDMAAYFRIFRSLGYRVTFVPAADLRYVEKYTAELQRMGVECLYTPFVTSVGEVLQARGREYDLVLLYQVHCAEAYLDLVRRYCPKARIVFDTVDLHYVREAREARLKGSERLVKEAEKTRERELSVIRRADRTIVLSPEEREILRREPDVDGGKIAVIPLIRDIPGSGNPFEVRRDILFVGGFKHEPNVDAVLAFVADVWPLIEEELPEAVFHVLGSHPPAAVQDLAGDRVVVTGYVPDLSPYFNRCRLSVAPLRYGAGLKGKVATSLGYGVPCVASSIAVEGTGLTDGEDVLVADDPRAFAGAVVRLYRDEALWNRLSANGLDFMERRFSFAAGRRELSRLLQSVGLPTE